MHTRDEASGLWCPMVRVARHEVIEDRRPAHGGMEIVSHEHHVVGGCNSASGTGRGPRNPASSRCIADQCAMWRWGTEPDPFHVPSEHPPASFRPAPRVRADVGYCGLAGSPAAC